MTRTLPRIVVILLLGLGVAAAGAGIVQTIAAGIGAAHGSTADELAVAAAGELAPPPAPRLIRTVYLPAAGAADAVPAPTSEPPPAAAPPPSPPEPGPAGPLDAGRRTGFLWILAGLALVKTLEAIRVRLAPAVGEAELEPGSWSARSIAILGAAVMVLTALVDAAFGPGWWASVITAAIGAGALLWDAFNPRRGAKRAPAAVAAGVLVALALAGCARLTSATCDHDDRPGVLDQAADVGKGILCGSESPPPFLPWSESPTFHTGWQVARALLCQPDPDDPAPAIAADVDTTATP